MKSVAFLQTFWDQKLGKCASDTPEGFENWLAAHAAVLKEQLQLSPYLGVVKLDHWNVKSVYKKNVCYWCLLSWWL